MKEISDLNRMPLYYVQPTLTNPFRKLQHVNALYAEHKFLNQF